MSLENAKAFADKVAASPELQAREAELTGSTIDELAQQVAEIAKAEGFDCTADEIKEAAKAHLGDLGEGELSDESLDNVAGGAAGKPVVVAPPGGVPPAQLPGNPPPNVPGKPGRPPMTNPGGPPIKTPPGITPPGKPY